MAIIVAPPTGRTGSLFAIFLHTFAQPVRSFCIVAMFLVLKIG